MVCTWLGARQGSSEKQHWSMDGRAVGWKEGGRIEFKGLGHTAVGGEGGVRILRAAADWKLRQEIALQPEA